KTRIEPSRGRSAGGRLPPGGTARRDPERDQEEDALPARMRGEERRHVVIEEREARGADALGVGGEVEPAADDPGLERGRPVAPIAVARERAVEVAEQDHIRARIRRDVLAEAQVARLAAEVAPLEEL